ncbi:hypothetical protein [Oceanobacter sp. 3_MG-2023]|uniref:hypothetical protein n=1 Tax=Oceanobacter sp. 3_MG-2023 TaxID=3062622 RepID=UPI0027328E48|nr:hypothetical protein [Oceanobacter sp. 3_MG-2023]MDP2505438.1 hypothetical protein [Oceanobacter sp. 3_MG-2023]
MREAVRCQYLKAMGIPVWVPRDELPHAAPSQLLPWLGEQHGPHGSELPVDHLPNYRNAEDHPEGGHFAAELLDHRGNTTTRVAVDAAVVSNRDSVAPAATALTDLPTSPPDSLVKPETAVAEPLVVADLTPPRFELHFIATGNGTIWVCDRQEQLPALQAFAWQVGIGMKWSPEQGSPLSFRWPFIEHGQEDQSSAVAEQALRAQWQFFVHHGGRHVIGFGSNTRQWLTRIQVPGCYQDDDVVTVMSCAERKKQLWLALLNLPMEQQ